MEVQAGAIGQEDVVGIGLGFGSSGVDVVGAIAIEQAVDSVMNIAEGMTLDKFQHYLDASKDDLVKVMLNELTACRNFYKQCSLWRNWANCDKPGVDDEWIIVAGCLLMESGNYSPILHRVWKTWRALNQTLNFGSSSDSSIPNQYYNEYRKKCYVTCLKRIERHPDVVYAMNCAAAIGGRTNMNRFGQNGFGNEAMTELGDAKALSPLVGIETILRKLSLYSPEYGEFLVPLQPHFLLVYETDIKTLGVRRHPRLRLDSLHDGL